MLHKCANPECVRTFRRLEEGKLFQVELEPSSNAGPSVGAFLRRVKPARGGEGKQREGAEGAESRSDPKSDQGASGHDRAGTYPGQGGGVRDVCHDASALAGAGAGGSAGRGMVFPFAIAKTYSHNDFSSTFEGEWSYASSIQSPAVAISWTASFPLALAHERAASPRAGRDR